MLEEELVKDNSPMWDMEFVPPPASARPFMADSKGKIVCLEVHSSRDVWKEKFDI